MQNKRVTLVLSSIFLISAVFCSGAYLAAQVSNTGTVLGMVTDSSAAFVPRVTVTLRNSRNGLVYQTQTDESGQFRFLTPVQVWGFGSNRAEIYSKERFFVLRGVLFGSELAKTTEPCVKFLRERPVSRKVRIQRAVFHAANRGSIVGDNFA